jgi:hypothetical protein
MEESVDVVPPASLDKENCTLGAKEKRVAAGAVEKKFPEGDCYEELLMEIVDKNNAHAPPKGGIDTYWTNMIIQ